MAKTEKDPLKTLSALMTKALRRGEKLERTLTKIVAHSESGSAAEDFLKAVQGGLKAICRNAKLLERSAASKVKKAPETKTKRSAKKANKPKAAPKKPAPTDIMPPTEAMGR